MEDDLSSGPSSDPVAAALTTAIARHKFVWLGLSADAAAKYAADAKLSYRVVNRDGKALPVTRDFRKGRVNTHLWQGRVIAVVIEGKGLFEGCSDVAFIGYVALTAKEAEAAAKVKSVPYRVVYKDGESCAVTADYIKERVNVHILAGQVVAVKGG